MNSELLNQDAAFKQQIQSLASKDERKESKVSHKSNSAPRKKPRLETPIVPKDPLRFRWIKLCVDRLKRRYQKQKKSIILEDLIKSVRLDLDPAEKNWLFNVLKENPKCHFDYEKKRFSFKPTYEMHNKDDLLNLLRDHYDNGLGGIMLDDVNECLLKPEEAINELKQADLVCK